MLTSFNDIIKMLLTTGLRSGCVTIKPLLVTINAKLLTPN